MWRPTTMLVVWNIGDRMKQMSGEKLNVLFLCTGNSCRSQMAEGLANRINGSTISAFSAGIETHGLNPNAVAVMAELGIDISTNRSKNIAEFMSSSSSFPPIDVVVTVCGHAHETCPRFPADCRVVHAGFKDPPRMAREVAARGGGEEEQLACYRAVRDEIRTFVEGMPQVLVV